MSDENRSSLRAAWQLAKPYWSSDDKWRAWGLLTAVVALNIVSVLINVRFNFWFRDFFNSIQQLNYSAFKHQFLIFGGLAAVAIAILVYQVYLQQMLQIRWRRWLTRRFLDTWLDERAYYRLQLLNSGTDNPDQRISDDLDRFTGQTLGLVVGTNGFLNAGITLVSFLGILWTLSGAVMLPLGKFGEVEIPGYMVWFALIYAVGGTWLAFRIGRPLVQLNFAQQRFEADFRFSMMRLRENAESVALYGGEKREHRFFIDRFRYVVNNFWSIMKRTKRLNWYTSSYNQFAIVFPYIVAAPRYFAKIITFGALQQTADAFAQVQLSLSFIVNSYTAIAQWQSVVQRLGNFDARARSIAAEARAPQRISIERAGNGISITALNLELPDGTVLQRDIHFEATPGEWLLITAPAGSGKSTLLRAMAGIWPFGSGVIRIGEGKTLFLSQRPYIPLGTLRGALLYPNEDENVSKECLAAVLTQVGLGGFARDCETPDNWAQRLSPGEQQRLAFARILLSKPAFIFMDEATSSIDEAGEAELYALLRKAPWKPTVISTGHRTSLSQFHDRVLPMKNLARVTVGQLSMTRLGVEET
ncbi:MAG TPA: ABC transporter ATP-binding protein/permease [Burkholderiales bacterium]|nr:ABC transporter ATP-binding protein/permease [Burkholderiales bacterium]